MFALMLIAALVPAAHAQTAYGRRLHSEGSERHLSQSAYGRRLESVQTEAVPEGLGERVQRLFARN